MHCLITKIVRAEYLTARFGVLLCCMDIKMAMGTEKKKILRAGVEPATLG